MSLTIGRHRILYKLLCLILIYMPLHYYICEIFISRTNIDNILRDVVIFFLFAAVMARSRFMLRKSDMIIVLNSSVLIIFAMVSMIFYGHQGTLNILRTYLVPSLIYFVCSRIKFDKTEFIFLHRAIVVELAIIGLYGFFQAFILGDKFLVNLGYESTGGFLSSTYYIGGYWGFQRSVGTFVSPNNCGLILALALCVYYFDRLDLKLKNGKLFAFMLIVGLIATFSRSAILGFIIAYLFFWIIEVKYRTVNIKKIISMIVFAVVGVVFILMIDKYILNNLFTSMLSSSFLGTISGTDLSAEKHLTDLIEPLKTVLKNPFGLGFGNHGPMAVGVSDSAFSVESSIYLMMYEVGIIFGILQFYPYVRVIILTIINQKYKYILPAAICFAVLTTYILLPNIQQFEIVFYSYFFIGLYYNKSVRDLFVK